MMVGIDPGGDDFVQIVQFGQDVQIVHFRPITGIPATEVLRVLQRVAEGDAGDVHFDGNDIEFTIFADGWVITCFDDAGELDGVYACRAPCGAEATLYSWHIDVEPTEMLSADQAAAILERRDRYVAQITWSGR